MTLSSSCASKKLPIKLVHKSRKNWLKCAIVILNHFLLVGCTIKDCGSKTQLSIKSIRKILNLIKKLVLNWMTKLNNLLGSIHVCDSVPGIHKLHLDVFNTFLRTLFTVFTLETIWHLNDDVKLIRILLRISGVKQSEL